LYEEEFPMSAASTMTAVKVLAKLLGKFALTVLLFWAAFSFLFHFGEAQALGLGLAFALAIDLAATRKPPEQAAFTPHRLILQFHLFPMLMDLGLIAGDEEWKSLIGDEPHAALWEPNSVYHRSIRAFVLGTSPDIIHFTDLRFYSGQLKLDVTLEGITLPSTYRMWSPEVFIKPGRGGYHIGYPRERHRVNDNWWETAKGKIAAGVVLEEDKEWNFATVRLSLAMLPYETTHTYYRETASGHQAAIKELVVKTGWTNSALGGPEIGYFGESYDHKYATVWAQHLDS
jgi:hypothetical protein